MSGYESDVRFIVCRECNGDGGWESTPHPYYGSRYVECSVCHGTGYEEIEIEPITEEDTHAAL